MHQETEVSLPTDLIKHHGKEVAFEAEILWKNSAHGFNGCKLEGGALGALV